MTGLELITAPLSEPVTLAEIKSQARIDGTADDAFLATLIAAARQWAEQYTARALMPQAWRLWRDDWPGPSGVSISLPKAPLQSVSEVRLYQTDDSSSVWDAANYQIDAVSQPGRLILRAGSTWPIAARAAQSISIGFTAGYANAAAVPESVKAAIRQLAAHWYEQRGEPASAALRETPYGVQSLLNPYRLRNFI